MDPRGVWGRGGAGPGLAHLPGNNAQTTVCVTQWQRAGVLSASFTLSTRSQEPAQQGGAARVGTRPRRGRGTGPGVVLVARAGEGSLTS